MRRTRSDCSGFVADTPHFVTGVRGDLVEWGYSGKHQGDVKAGITVEDLTARALSAAHYGRGDSRRFESQC